jgi:hypothetical protein
MHLLTDLVALLGTRGACANASRSLAEEREVTAHLDQFLLRFEHPAGTVRVPVEPPAGDAARVA